MISFRRSFDRWPKGTRGSLDDPPKTFLGKVWASLFFAVFLGMGLLFLVLIGKMIGGIATPYLWKSTPAVILSSEVKRQDDQYAVVFRYRYEWEGQKYTSKTYWLPKKNFSNSLDAYEVIEALPAETETVCRVNPEKPDEAVLRCQSLLQALFIFLPLVFVGVGAGGIWGTWFGRERAQSLSTKNGNRIRKFVGFVFAVIGGSLLILWSIPMWQEALSSDHWKETPCRIVSSKVKSHSGKNGTTYSVDIAYRYQWKGRFYESNRYHPVGGSSSGRESKAEIVALYPVGSEALCYVNPNKPAAAFLKPGWTWAALFGLLPLIFLGIGVTLLWLVKPDRE